MKIVTWNVNSLRARLGQLLDWMEANRPDVVCIQETKISDQEFPVDDFGDLDYDAAFHGDRAYAGVAILSKDELSAVHKGWTEGDKDMACRILGATIRGIRIVSVYVPNGQSVGSDKFAHKLEWMARFRRFLDRGPPPTSPLVVCGDFNVAPSDLDVYDARAFVGRVHVSPPEREAYREIVAFGLTDVHRHLHPEGRQYTWWDYRAGGVQKDLGMRIDHFLVTQPVLRRVRSISVDMAARREEKASDHAPVILEIEDSTP